MTADNPIDDAVNRLVGVLRQDQCADGHHDYNITDGYLGRTCICGAVHPDDLDPDRRAANIVTATLAQWNFNSLERAGIVTQERRRLADTIVEALHTAGHLTDPPIDFLYAVRDTRTGEVYGQWQQREGADAYLQRIHDDPRHGPGTHELVRRPKWPIPAWEVAP